MQRVKELADAALHPVYRARGRRPWSPGYQTAKRRAIEQAIDERLLAGGGALPAAFGAGLDERVIEYAWVYARLPSAPGTVLDAGSSLNHRFLLDRPPIADANLTICTLAPEKRCYWTRAISYVYDDLRDSRFNDGAFDVVISISTVEHIGLDNARFYTADGSKRESDRLGFVPALHEFRRVLKPGGTCFVTVPFGRVANHGWFQVFDGAMVQSMIEAFGPSETEIAHFGYSAAGWSPATADALKDATFFDINARASYDADLAAGARGVVCLRLTAPAG